MTNRIEQLSIKGFRGASRPFTLEFDDEKPVTLIFGENGSGKSTLVDAIECIANGTTSFKDNWKLGQGKRKDSFIPTLGMKPDDVELSLRYGGQTFNATSANLTANVPAVRVLRRKSLQEYIEADAAERYRVVASFLDIPKIETSEESLRKAAKQAADAVDRSTIARIQAEESLNEHWEAAGTPGLGGKYKNAESWAREEASVNTEELDAEQKELEKRVSVVEEITRKAERYIASKTSLEQSREDHEKAIELLGALEQDAAKGNVQLVTLLQDAKTYLTKSPQTLCPVCEETEIDSGILVQRLDQRLGEMTALNQAGAALRSAAKNESSQQTLNSQAINEFLVATMAALDIFGETFGRSEEIKTLHGDNPQQAAEIALSLNELLSQQLRELQQSVGEIQKRLHTLSSVRQLVKTLDEKTAEAKDKDVLRAQLANAVKVFEAQRKTYVEKTLLDIGESIDALYQQIHPDEEIGKLKLNLAEKKRASLDYGVTFGGQDVQPQPYYSESHLDTLGLCIFLALAKRHAGADAIIVLDDILVSVDQQHLHRAVDMLIAESANVAQIIITTHYRPLRNRFTNSRTGSSKVKLVDLKPWTLTDGVRFTTPKLALDELENKLEEDNVARDEIAIAAGRLLENAFDYLALIYGLRMARRPEPKYDLGELFSAVRGIKAWQTTHGDESTEIKPLLESLAPLMPVRNEVGAHYNESGEELSDADITEFGMASLAWLKALICPGCNGLAQKQVNIGHWKCLCGKTTMKPFKV